MLQKWLFISAIFISSNLESECLPGDSLWNRIILLRESTTVAADKQLQELLGYLRVIETCNYKNDSTHALLLQRIGWLYTEQNDYVNAIQFTRKAIDIIDKQKNPARVKRDFTIKCFYNLNLMYSSLKLPTQKESAIDSNV